MYGDPHKLTQEAVEGYARPLVRPGRFEHGVRIAQCWWHSMAELEEAMPLAADIPTLLIWGSQDRMVELSSAERLKGHFHHAKLAVMQGAGHIPYEERPEEFCRIVLDFLRRHSPARVFDGK
jgi:pimeloyl-ACP methyl ester carboxylesterase